MNSDVTLSNTEALPAGQIGTLQGPRLGRHLVQFFESDDRRVDTVTRFVGASLCGGDACLVVATASHISSVEHLLEMRGMNLDKVKATGQLTMLDAAATLASFMGTALPDSGKFEASIGGLIDKIASRFPRLSVYGEMVGLLWDKENPGA